ncbi:MAG: nucleotide exchange factor GrpE [Proteobacteria bacterium]|nr:nucleotide exchange factor GrpE [Pseudomonadota bacterium]MBU1740056.1 nucleotide exchange factor GrpE [Pseudomonadota bacterium]
MTTPEKRTAPKKTKINVRSAGDTAAAADKKRSDPAAQPARPDPAREQPEDLEELERQAEQHYDKYLRACADLENYRKRAERERLEYLKYANEALIKELLIVSDNLCRALEHADTEANAAPLKEGVEMTLKGLMGVLARFGVKEVEALGCPFDPNHHEAVSVRESDQAENNMVTDVAQKGYLLHDRLIRPAMVVVNRRPEGGDDTG